jgi:hypothetical protein
MRLHSLALTTVVAGVLPGAPDAGSPLRWILPLAIVVGMLVLGAAVALVRATGRLRLKSPERPGAAATRGFNHGALPGGGLAESAKISGSLNERLASYGHSPQREAADERLTLAEDAAVLELTDAERPQLEHVSEASLEDSTQRAQTLPVEAEQTERLIGPRAPHTLYGVATVLELAQHADVSAENVLRVVNGHPVSSVVAERFRQAIDELGPPYAGALESGPVEATLERTRQQLQERFAETAAELEAKLPEGVGSVVYEALRVEVRPVATQLGQMAKLVEVLLEHVRQTEGQIQSERKERLDDVALMTELITTGWRTVDRRLGRIERMLEDLRRADGTEPRTTRHIF